MMAIVQRLTIGRNRRRMTTLVLIVGALAALSLLSMYSSLVVASAGRTPRSRMQKWFAPADVCASWDPAADPIHDPPGCLRAAQYRQVQEFLTDPKYNYEPRLMTEVDRLKNCTLGIIECPPRPLIVSIYWFLFKGRETGGSTGEELWMIEVANAMIAEGFIILDDYRMARMLHFTRVLSLSVHMVWMNENNVIESLNGFYKHNLNLIPAAELGAIPLWRLFCVTYWGSRPSNADRPGFRMNDDWDIPLTGGNEVWSFHPLGRRWQLTPFPYPEHTWIPVTVERECKAMGPVTNGTRKDNVLVLGKRTQWFTGYEGKQVAVKFVKDKLAEAGFTAHFLSNIKLEKDEKEDLIPVGLENLGEVTREKYVELVSDSKVMLGLGFPVISPSPMIALCRGTPVVLPYNDPNDPEPKGWEMYSMHKFQHGPLNALPEPYVYNYLLGNNTQLAEQIAKALVTPIKPYTPKGYSATDLVNRVHTMLHYDYEREFRRIWKTNGCETPRVPTYMLDACWSRDNCFFGPHKDIYIAD